MHEQFYKIMLKHPAVLFTIELIALIYPLIIIKYYLLLNYKNNKYNLNIETLYFANNIYKL